MPSRQFQKGPGETYPDVTRFTERAPEPKVESDADDHLAAAYGASCETAMGNANLDALKRGAPASQKNIKEIAGES